MPASGAKSRFNLMRIDAFARGRRTRAETFLRTSASTLRFETQYRSGTSASRRKAFAGVSFGGDFGVGHGSAETLSTSSISLCLAPTA